MQVKDIMTTDVITITEDTPVEEIAALLLEHRISGVPVVDADRRVIGIVSEGDLMRRPENDTERPRSWWLRLMSGNQELIHDYLKTHGLRAGQVMTRSPLTVTEQTTLGDVAQLLEKKRIKRVPVVRDGKLTGIVSRANLLRGLASYKDRIRVDMAVDDRTLREKILTELNLQRDWLTHGIPNVFVSEGLVELWGWVDSEQERAAILLLVESITGVRSVDAHLGFIKPQIRNV
jgi:CBS domain-containing protein